MSTIQKRHNRLAKISQTRKHDYFFYDVYIKYVVDGDIFKATIENCEADLELTAKHY